MWVEWPIVAFCFFSLIESDCTRFYQYTCQFRKLAAAINEKLLSDASQVCVFGASQARAHPFTATVTASVLRFSCLSLLQAAAMNRTRARVIHTTHSFRMEHIHTRTTNASCSVSNVTFMGTPRVLCHSRFFCAHTIHFDLYLFKTRTNNRLKKEKKTWE